MKKFVSWNSDVEQSFTKLLKVNFYGEFECESKMQQVNCFLKTQAHSMG